MEEIIEGAIEALTILPIFGKDKKNKKEDEEDEKRD